MTEKPWLDYDGQSTEELLALAPNYREDSVFVAFETALVEKDKAELTDEEKVVLAVEAMEREVNNGGYDQFFINSSVEFAPSLVDSLKTIGCPETAAITERALRSLGLRSPSAPEEVETVLQQQSPRRDKELDACDQAYYARTEDIAGALLGFIRKNASKITLG